MSTREYAQSLLDRVPESRLFYVVSCLQNAVQSDEVPNEETLEAMHEINEKIESGGCKPFYGSTADYFDMLLSEA